jgi:hypothetical protein
MPTSAKKMIPIAACPKCKAEFWLLDEEMYEPGAQRAKSPGKAAVTFICCGNPQSVRRFTRLTNAFSKKIENHGHAIALHFMHYNFCRVHQTLRVTPAMEAGITNHVWSIEELVSLLDRSDRIAA